MRNHFIRARRLMSGAVAALVLSLVAMQSTVFAQGPLAAQIQQFWNGLRQGAYSFTTLATNASGYHNFGTTLNANGYGFRDNAGTMQVKNSGGSWANIAASGGSATFTDVTSTSWFRGPVGCGTIVYSFTTRTTTGLCSSAVDTLDAYAGNTQATQWTTTFFKSFLPVYLPNGTAANPAQSFTSDTNTGRFWLSNDAFAESIGGTKIVAFDGNGLNLLNSVFLTWSTNPGSVAPNLRIGQVAAGQFIFEQDSTHGVTLDVTADGQATLLDRSAGATATFQTFLIVTTRGGSATAYQFSNRGGLGTVGDGQLLWRNNAGSAGFVLDGATDSTLKLFARDGSSAGAFTLAGLLTTGFVTPGSDNASDFGTSAVRYRQMFGVDIFADSGFHVRNGAADKFIISPTGTNGIANLSNGGSTTGVRVNVGTADTIQFLKFSDGSDAATTKSNYFAATTAFTGTTFQSGTTTSLAEIVFSTTTMTFSRGDGTCSASCLSFNAGAATGLLPSVTNQIPLGGSSNRFTSVFAVLGDFSGTLNLGASPSTTGTLKTIHGATFTGLNAASNADYTFISFGSRANNATALGSTNGTSRVTTTMATPGSLANGDWWVESDTGAVTGTVGRLKAQLNGATVTIGDSNSDLCSSAAPTRASGFGTNADASFATGSTTCSFDMNIGTGGAPTSGVLTLPTAAHGWICQVHDATTIADNTYQSAYTASTATFTTTLAWSANDHLYANCGSF